MLKLKNGITMGGSRTTGRFYRYRSRPAGFSPRQST